MSSLDAKHDDQKGVDSASTSPRRLTYSTDRGNSPRSNSLSNEKESFYNVDYLGPITLEYLRGIDKPGTAETFPVEDNGKYKSPNQLDDMQIQIEMRSRSEETPPPVRSEPQKKPISYLQKILQAQMAKAEKLKTPRSKSVIGDVYQGESVTSEVHQSNINSEPHEQLSQPDYRKPVRKKRKLVGAKPDFTIEPIQHEVSTFGSPGKEKTIESAVNKDVEDTNSEFFKYHGASHLKLPSVDQDIAPGAVNGNLPDQNVALIEENVMQPNIDLLVATREDVTTSEPIVIQTRHSLSIKKISNRYSAPRAARVNSRKSNRGNGKPNEKTEESGDGKNHETLEPLKSMSTVHPSAASNLQEKKIVDNSNFKSSQEMMTTTELFLRAAKQSEASSEINPSIAKSNAEPNVSEKIVQTEAIMEDTDTSPQMESETKNTPISPTESMFDVFTTHSIPENSEDFLQNLMNSLKLYAFSRDSRNVDMSDLILYLRQINFGGTGETMGDIERIFDIAQENLPLELIIDLENSVEKALSELETGEEGGLFIGDEEEGEIEQASNEKEKERDDEDVNGSNEGDGSGSTETDDKQFPEQEIEEDVDFKNKDTDDDDEVV
ncbi:hypothetical protein FOB60_001417 [Candida parapsilosis]|uniref:CENP-T/Histone H4 histone fold domain-containing protein n=1 Tax=Candida parapsilosis TaxID=5480 RepID=A0A8X7NQW5_CANPA|nr:hypothetical protein FOB60_001417 [Candida parapsilosis]